MGIEVCRINILRHPKTPWNKENWTQSSTDVPLDSEGLADAAAYGWMLRNEKIDLIVTSPLKRAKQTGLAIAQNRDIPVVVAPGLTERVFGPLLEGTDHIKTRELRHNFLINQGDNPLGIETDESLRRRVTPVLKHLVQAYMGLHILVINHSSLMRYMLHKYGGRTYQDMVDMPIDNGSMIKIFSDGQGMVASPNPIVLNY